MPRKGNSNYCQTNWGILRMPKIMFSKLGCVINNWAQHHIYFSKAALFISGLVFSHGLAENAVMCILISYFMETWNMTNLRQAAAVVNVEGGVSAIVAIILSYISDAYLCHLKVIVYTSALFIVGLVLLGVSTWLDPELKARLLYPIVMLIALGKAGRDPTLKAFLLDQLTDDSKDNQAIDEEQVEARRNFWWRVAWSLGVVASFSLSNCFWRSTFLTSAIIMAIAYLWFLSGVKFYCCKKPAGSPLAIVYKVSKAALLKRHLAYPITANAYFKNDTNDQLLILRPDVPFFRQETRKLFELYLPIFSPLSKWLDKASILESSSRLRLDEQETKGRLYTVAQVKRVKCLLTIVPIWTTFFVYGMIEATGRTFFVEQANNLDDSIGSLSLVPLTLFFAVKSSVTFVISSLLHLLFPKWLSGQRIILVRIGIGMVFAMFSCIAAWQVEVHRLHLISNQYTMSIFWIAPQFILLGLMAGFTEDGLSDLFYNQGLAQSNGLTYKSSSSMDCALGIGHFLSVLFAFLFRAWFGDNINSSRLDKYFLMLAILGFGNLCLYCLVSLVSYKKFWREEEVREEYTKSNPNNDELGPI